MAKPKKSRLGSAKRAGRPRSLTDLVRPIAKKALGGRTLALRELILSWPTAVGPEFAAGTRPEALSRARAGEACLTLAVDPGRALKVQHETQRFVERVNTYFGYKMINRLKLVQRSVRTGEARSRRPEPPPVDQQVRRTIANRLDGIKDDGTRAVLQEMGELVQGRKIHRRNRRTETKTQTHQNLGTAPN